MGTNNRRIKTTRYIGQDIKTKYCPSFNRAGY